MDTGTKLTLALTRQRMEHLLGRCRDLAIGVVGDLALDAYWYADMRRSLLSRETPHYPRPVIRETYSPGAGANVADNLAALGVGHVEVVSVVGDDWRGEALRRLLAARDIDVSHLIVSELHRTTAYIKPILMGYASQQEDARLDFENDAPLDASLELRLIEEIMARFDKLDALLVADQLERHGTITPRVRTALNALAAQHPDTWMIADSRRNIGQFADCVVKPNRLEAANALAPADDPAAQPSPSDLALALHAQTHRPVFITLGEEGVLVCAESQAGVVEQQRLPAGPVTPPLDTVGAGDSFAAALAAALAAGASAFEAGAFANLAAAVTVEKLNITGTAAPEELRARYAMAEARDALENGL